MDNEILMKELKKYRIALLILIIIQATVIFGIAEFTKNLMPDATISIPKDLTSLTTENMFSKYFPLTITILLIVMCLICDLLFYERKIIRIKKLNSITPTQCIYEDAVIFTYSSGDRRKCDHYIGLILKNTTDGKLYLTFGDYCIFQSGYISNFKATMSSKSCKIKEFKLIKYKGLISDDNTRKEIEIGDTVTAYIQKPLNKKIEYVNERMAKISGQKYGFDHVNKQYGDDFLKDIILFNGAVCVL